MVVELGSAGGAAALRRLTLPEATAALTRHSFSLSSSPDGLVREAFLRSTAVAVEVPCLRLDYPRTWDIYPEVMALVESVEAALP